MIKNVSFNFDGIGHVVSYRVTADDLHIFISDMKRHVKAYKSDLYLDYEHMLHNMREGAGYVWSIRESGTWLMPIAIYAKAQPDQFTTPIIRFIVKRNGDTYNFTEYIEL